MHRTLTRTQAGITEHAVMFPVDSIKVSIYHPLASSLEK